MKNYDHKEIEPKWQREWEKDGIYQALDNSDKRKYYCLIEFPYPSGDGLHVGHIRSNTAMDVIARKRRAEGYNVLYPIGWDAFGLPTENYAIKTGVQPAIVTKQNTDIFRRQLQSLGFSFDWSREINTTDPGYYKWTQWIFLQLFKKGLAYKKKMAINWCPKCLIGLANEEVVSGNCERCGTPVEKRDKEQWMLAITKYADRLDKDLDTVDYLEKIKIQQRHWIGRSVGAEFEFKIVDSGEKVSVFTTRADTLFGVTYVVLAPEHELIQKLKSQIKNWPAVEEYLAEVKTKTEMDRITEGREKTGVVLDGVFAINPANQEKVPVWIADYVLVSYGTGAVMAVPAHDERDYAFAKKFNLPIKQVIMPCEDDSINPPREGFEEVVRDTIIVHLRDKSTGKFALLDWHESLEGITTAIMGGIEAGQTPEEAALMEIKEEASLEGIVIKNKLRWITAAKYCASHKKQNRKAVSYGILAEIDSLKNQGVIAESEQKLHTLVWVDEDLVIDRLTPDHQKLVWNQLISETALSMEGEMINSNEFDGLASEEAQEKITNKFGQQKVTYKLRDWVFSRQHYWGEPIPMIKCSKCGWVSVPEKDLPVTLPAVERYQPTETGESPLAGITDWVKTTCPTCAGPAERETDTMPNWAGSSWYYLRYVDSRNIDAFASLEKLKHWTPVDWYNGGMEHTTLHLLYSRFWHKFLFDLGLVPSSEPYQKRTSHGMILAEGGEKMSKSRGNVVNPDKFVELYGADTLRLYEMFMGPFDQAIAWSTESLIGPRRFLERVWRLRSKVAKKEESSDNSKLTLLLHQTIKKVSEDVEAMRFNTAISSLMILVNSLETEENISRQDYELMLQLLAPFAPHLTEELWHELGNSRSIHLAPWPKYDPDKIIVDEITIAIQINGILRDTIKVSPSLSPLEIEIEAKNRAKIQKWLVDKKIKKVVHVPGKLVNIVI